MKQVIQSARWGQLDVEDVPRPSAAPGEPLVAAIAGGGEPPVPAGELLEVSRAAVAADRARMGGQWIRLLRMAP